MAMLTNLEFISGKGYKIATAINVRKGITAKGRHPMSTEHLGTGTLFM